MTLTFRDSVGVDVAQNRRKKWAKKYLNTTIDDQARYFGDMERQRNRKVPYFLEFTYRTVRKFEIGDWPVITEI